MLFLRSLLFNILMYVMLLVVGVLGVPLALWSVDGAYAVVRFYCRRTIWLARILCGMRLEIRGTIPGDNVIVCSKHQSFFDIIILSAHLPRFKFVMKRELIWAPVVGFYAMRLRSTPVTRGKRAQAMKDMIANVESNADATPTQLVIYPQGTRVAPGAHVPYKVGAGVLYQRGGVPCVPAATNVGVFWGRKTFYRHSGTVVMEFCDPIPAGLAIQDFMERVERIIETRSDALMREAGFDLGEKRPHRA